jgi:hypothetical protein
MLRFVPALLVLALGSVNCSNGSGGQPAQTPQPGQTAQPAQPSSAIMHSTGSVIQTTVDGSRIYGPMVMLERDDAGLRGSGPTGVVDLRKDSDSLRGFIGTGPTELHLETVGEGGFMLRGMFGGALGRLEVRSDRIEGQLGRCQYNLRRQPSDLGVAYNGRRVCSSRSFEPATITLSPEIAALEPIDRAAVIAILLGR